MNMLGMPFILACSNIAQVFFYIMVIFPQARFRPFQWSSRYTIMCGLDAWIPLRVELKQTSALQICSAHDATA